MKRASLALLLLVLLFVAFQLSWFRGSYAQVSANSSPTPTATPVDVAKVSSLARLEPDGKVVSLAAPSELVQERVLRWNVKEGESVRRGQALLVLDAQDRLQREVEVAQSKVAVSQAKLDQVLAGAKAGEQQAQHYDIGRVVVDRAGSLEVQMAVIHRDEADLRLQKAEYERYSTLYKEGAAAASLLDQKRFAYESSQTQLEQARAEYSRQQRVLGAQAASARARLEQIQEVRPTDVSFAEAELRSSQADLDKARTMLAKCIVRSPQDGVVLKILTLTGEKVANSGLLQLGQTDRMVAVAEVYDSQILQVQVGQSVRLRGRALHKQELRGKVYRIGKQVEKQNVFSNEPGENFDRRIIEVRIRLDGESSRMTAGLTNLQLEALFE